jgi:hypothetical protein
MVPWRRAVRHDARASWRGGSPSARQARTAERISVSWMAGRRLRYCKGRFLLCRESWDSWPPGPGSPAARAAFTLPAEPEAGTARAGGREHLLTAGAVSLGGLRMRTSRAGMVTFLAALGVLAGVPAAHAAAGDLDPGFGSGGIVMTSYNGPFPRGCRAAAGRPDRGHRWVQQHPLRH